MANRTIEVEEDSLEAARASIQAQVPAGQTVLSERVIADGKPCTVQRSADSMDAALVLARAQVAGGAAVVEEKRVREAQERRETVEAFEEPEIPSEIEKRLGPDAVVKAARVVAVGRKGFLGVGRKRTSYEVEVFLPARASVTWKQRARVVAEVGERPRVRFDRYMGSGVCDVCNAPISPGQAFTVPVSTFYSAPGYRTYLRSHPMVAIMGGDVDSYIANMRSMDSTPHSAVCSSCVHMFG